jgi:hypothetical protein
MTQMKDFADEEVKGLARCFPTALSKIIVLSVIPVCWAVLTLLLSNPAILNTEEGTLAHKAAAGLWASLSVIFMLLVLSVDLAVALHHSKHRRVKHASNEHPFMTWQFFFKNAHTKHWLVLFFAGLFCFLLGFGTSGLV